MIAREIKILEQIIERCPGKGMKGDHLMFMPRKCILFLFILILPFLLSACSHVVYPRGPIPVGMDKVGRIDTHQEISLINKVAESKLTLAAVQGYDKFLVDYKHWTDLIVDQLKTELAKRGVQVKPQGDHTFNISTTNIRYFWGAWAVRCIVNVRVERSDGAWSKEYEGNNAGHQINRATDGAVHKVVAEIIGDYGFTKALQE